MASYDYDIAIIGGGAAGLTVTAGAARLGARTLLIEKEPVLGGDCLHYGCVPSKNLIHSARIYHTIGQSRNSGLPAATVGPVEFRQDFLAAGQKRTEILLSAQRTCHGSLFQNPLIPDAVIMGCGRRGFPTLTNQVTGIIVCQQKTSAQTDP